MSGPPNGGGPARAMSVGNGPPSAGLPPHNAMASQQGPPPTGSSGPQSQQNLNQIVSESAFPLIVVRRAMPLHPAVTGSLCERNARPPWTSNMYIDLPSSQSQNLDLNLRAHCILHHVATSAQSLFKWRPGLVAVLTCTTAAELQPTATASLRHLHC
jgi:hypothetical protein